MQKEIVKAPFSKELSPLYRNFPIFFIGSAHSGKSEIAMEALDPEVPALVLGTAAGDEPNFEDRLKELQALRSKHWVSLDVKSNLVEHLEENLNKYPQILVDSLSQYFATTLVKRLSSYSLDQISDQLEYELKELIALLQKQKPEQRLILVSSEIASGISPQQRPARFYREITARCNKEIAKKVAKSVVLITAGIPTLIKG